MVEYITIGEVKFPFVFNFYVMGLVQMETGIPFEELSNVNSYLNKLYLIEPVIYYGIKYGCLSTKTDMPIKREEMPVLLSDNKIYIDFLPLITKFLIQDVNGEKPVADSKKNLI